MIYRLGIVSQRLLRKPLRVATLERPLRPSVTVGVQRYTLDLKACATLPELGRPISGANRSQVRKERPVCRPPPQNRDDFIAETNQNRLNPVSAAGFELLPRVREGAVIAVNVICRQSGRFGL